MKFIRIIVDIFIFVVAIISIFMLCLSMNITGHGPNQEETIARLFSNENIIETVITAAVMLAIVLPIRWAIMRRIGKSQNE